MKFLEELGFDKKQVEEIENIIPDKVISKLETYSDIVTGNINYLKELGVENYDEAFKKFYNMFLIDCTNFRKIFEKYDREDLVEKLKNNISIIEFL